MICGTWEMSSFHAALPYECCLVSALCAFGWVNQAKLQPPNSLPTNILQSKVKTLQSDPINANQCAFDSNMPTNPACHTCRKLAHHLPCHLKLSFRMTQLKTLDRVTLPRASPGSPVRKRNKLKHAWNYPKLRTSDSKPNLFHCPCIPSRFCTIHTWYVQVYQSVMK